MSRNLRFSRAIALVGFFAVGCMVATAQESDSGERISTIAEQLDAEVTQTLELIRSDFQRPESDVRTASFANQDDGCPACAASNANTTAVTSCPACRDGNGSESCPALQQSECAAKDEVVAIPQGFKVVAVKVSADDSINGLLQPGDYVDVLGVYKMRTNGENTSISKTFLKNVKVFSVEPYGSQDVDAGSKTIVGLLVNERQSEHLLRAQKVAQVKLAIRGDVDERVTELVQFDERLLPPRQSTIVSISDGPKPGFIQNQHLESSAYRHCDDLADTMSDCLADSNMSPDSRRRILETTMKLLVRNAELESQVQVARLQLEHERELSSMRGEVAHLRAQISAVGEIKTWMGPLYTNQNQSQQQMNNLMTNLQLVNRTLRMLEKEKDDSSRMQANQPLPAQLIVPQTQPLRSQRPERWSQLPSHARPQPQLQPQLRPRTERDDHTTQNNADNRGDTYLSRSTSQVAPPRLTDEAVRRQQLKSHLRQLQAELDRTNSQAIQPAGWEQPIPQQYPNQLRPLPAVQSIPSSVQRR